MQEKKYISLKELSQLIGVSKQGVYYKMANQNFPKPALKKDRFSYWDVREIKEYYNAFGFKFTLKKGLIEK